MKKVFLSALSAALLLTTACTKDDRAGDGSELSATIVPPDGWQDVAITFGIGGDSARTRASLQDVGLTDLWVFDDGGDGLQMLLHQQAGDGGFGSVRLSLRYGIHNLRFVASRGDGPTVSDGIISWAKPSDTFWAGVPLDVSPSAPSVQPVTLRRAATRLRINVADELPDGAAVLSVAPGKWYYGIDVMTGDGADIRTQERTVQIPASYAGTGGLTASFFGLSPSEAWQTDVDVAVKSSGGSVLGSVSLTDVGFSRNVTTLCSGNLFSTGCEVAVSVDDAWGDDVSREW